MIKKQVIVLLFTTSIFACAQVPNTFELKLDISVSSELHDQLKPNGRLLVFLSESARGEPRFQLWPAGNNNIYAKNINSWDPGKSISMNSGSGYIKTPEFDMHVIPEGTYYLQVLWDQDRAESRSNAPGNLYSEVKMIDLTEDLSLDVVLGNVVPPRKFIDHEYVKLVEMESKLLSDWWNKPVILKASILLPDGYFDIPSTKYPVRYNIAGYGGRYTRVSYLVERDTTFSNWWFSGEAPQIINVFLDGEGPFGDSYQLDSENNGPYGEALTKELIPYIEKEFRGIGTPESRFVDGCSTGGWVSLALQIFYPDFFNGVWSYSPDAIDFENYQLINIYKDDNAFINEWGALRPVARDITGDPILTVKDFIQYENVLGYSDSYVTSGGQFSAHTALYSPKGEDGLPIPLFDPYTGTIDHEVAEKWKKYDLKMIVEENWNTLGPKLQRKIWIWMGDMDNFILNPATRAFDEFLKTTENPKSDATITFTPMQGHCWQFNHKDILEMMNEKYMGRDN
ncbi:alpha/beta hydrolase [Bacteroidota bacterium]